jgi:hypothetical protein
LKTFAAVVRLFRGLRCVVEMAVDRYRPIRLTPARVGPFAAALAGFVAAALLAWAAPRVIPGVVSDAHSPGFARSDGRP